MRQSHKALQHLIERQTDQLSRNARELEHLREVINLYIIEAVQMTELLEKFFELLECTEESDNGNTFHPVAITSCRIIKTQEANAILEGLKKFIGGGPTEPARTQHTWINGDQVSDI